MLTLKILLNGINEHFLLTKRAKVLVSKTGPNLKLVINKAPVLCLYLIGMTDNVSNQ